MGNRGQILVLEDTHSNGVYLYTHSTAAELPSTLKQALLRAKAGGRLDDAPYLTRIIFSEMVRGELMETTGFGISSRCQDEENNQRLVVDVVEQTVSWLDEDGEFTTQPLAAYLLISFREATDEWEMLRSIPNGC